MRRSLCEVLVHAVWGTWDRNPLLVPEIEARVHAVIAAKCRRFGCLPWAIGGAADHVHVLTALDATISIARLVQEIKGASSHFVTHELGRQGLFKWQGSYAAFSVGSTEFERVRSYVLNQHLHHRQNEIQACWELEPAKAGEAITGAASAAGSLSRP
jgi:REP element-mobilizing transposase RayT